MNPSEHGMLASLIGLAFGFIKILENLALWGIKRMKNSKESGSGNVTVRLDADVSRMVRETHERAVRADSILCKTDNDGIPMVFTPRSLMENQLRMAEALRDVGSSCERINSNIERVAHRQEGQGEKLDEILDQVK